MRQSRFGKLTAALAVAGMLAAQSALLAAAPEKAAPKVFLGIGAAPQSDAAGVVIREVAPDSPAGKAGLKSGDRIVKVNDKEVKSFADLQKVLAGHQPGDELVLQVMREDKPSSFRVKLASWPEKPAGTEKPAAAPRAYLGVHTQPLTPEIKDDLGLTVDEGAVVTQVMPHSPAAKAGLKEKDVITRVGTSAVADAQGLRDLIVKQGAGKETTLTVMRGTEATEVKVRLSEAPAETAGIPESFVNPMQLWQSLDKVQSLDKKIEQLENRVRELEQKLAK